MDFIHNNIWKVGIYGLFSYKLAVKTPCIPNAILVYYVLDKSEIFIYFVLPLLLICISIDNHTAHITK